MWVVILCGMPASGKSYLRERLIKTVMHHITDVANDLADPINEHEAAALNYCRKFRIVQASSDDVLDMIAATQGRGYSDIFDTYMHMATTAFWHRLHLAVACHTSLIVVDRTFLSEKSRRDVITTVQQQQEFAGVKYKFMVVDVLRPDQEEWELRLLSRPGKTIPQAVLTDMEARYTSPAGDKFLYDALHTVNTGEANAHVESIWRLIMHSVPEFRLSTISA